MGYNSNQTQQGVFPFKMSEGPAGRLGQIVGNGA